MVEKAEAQLLDPARGGTCVHGPRVVCSNFQGLLVVTPSMEYTKTQAGNLPFANQVEVEDC